MCRRDDSANAGARDVDCRSPDAPPQSSFWLVAQQGSRVLGARWLVLQQLSIFRGLELLRSGASYSSTLEGIRKADMRSLSGKVDMRLPYH